MAQILVQEAASWRLDGIFRHSRDRWGEAQAERYTHGLFESFHGLLTGKTLSRPVPAELGISGYFFRYERHFVYWRHLPNGDIGIVTILHERMHQMDRFKDDWVSHGTKSPP